MSAGGGTVGPAPGPAPAAWWRRGRAAAVPLVLAVVWLALGDPARGLASAAIALLLASAAALGVDVDAAVRAVARRVGDVLAAVLFGIVLVPAWLWSATRRTERRWRGSDGWHVHGRDAPATSLASVAPAGPPTRSWPGRITWAAGVLVVVLAVNYGLGWGWDEAFGSSSRSAATLAPLDTPRGSVIPAGAPDPRANTPALVNAPWAPEMLAELTQVPYGYWPFVGTKAGRFHSPYLNVDGWVRRSYETPGSSPRPTIWFMGSSTMFGEGQRDGYTIASWVARLAQQAGLPIRVVNYGQRGFVSFQEMLLYEQLLASEPAPMSSVFLDGVNDLDAQTQVRETIPVPLLFRQEARRLGDVHVGTEVVAPPGGAASWSAAWDAYARHSAVHKLARWLEGRADAATPAATANAPGPTQTKLPDSPELGRKSLDVYTRARTLELALSAQHHVRQLLFWQPFLFPAKSLSWFRSHLTPPTIDIGDTFHGRDQRSIFIDAIHTNEVGARLVAEQIWQRLEPQVRAWHRTHG